VTFGRFVQPMIGLRDAPLACMFIGSNRWHAHEDESTRHRRRKTGPYPKRFIRLYSHFCFSPQTID